MNNKDKQLIADYMELIFNPARMSLYEYKDGREFKFNSTDASFCVQEMQKRGEFVGFEVFALTEYQVYNPDMIESDNIVSEYIAWLYNAENFFAALAQWLREGK